MKSDVYLADTENSQFEELVLRAGDIKFVLTVRYTFQSFSQPKLDREEESTELNLNFMPLFNGVSIL